MLNIFTPAKGFWSVGQFKKDFAGGISSMLVSLPLNMTIGVIAFSPLGKEYLVQGVLAGVFGAIILSICTVLLGSRSVLVSGPRAASALILASLITHLLLSEDLMFPSGTTVTHVIAIAFFAIFLAGGIQMLAGLTRFSNIVKHIPHPVTSGFINSTALLIILGQSWTLLDIRKQESLLDIFSMLDEMRPMTMVPAIITIVVMILSPRFIKRVPAPLMGLGAGTVAFYGIRAFLDGFDMGPTLGEITTRLPMSSFPEMFSSLTAGDDLLTVLIYVIPAALAMATLSSLDTVFSLSALDDKLDKRTDTNHEIAVHGAGNMIASLFGGLNGAGGMVRTKPALDAGGATQAFVMTSAILMLGGVLVFAEFIEYIPRAVISGMVIVLGFQLFDSWSFSLLKNIVSRNALRRSSAASDFIIVILVIAVALVFDLITAVGVGILVSLITFVSRMSRSLVRSEFRGPAIHARSMWDARRQKIIEKVGYRIAVLELEGAIFFGTADGLEGKIYKLMDDGVTHVVLDLKRIKDIDTTGALMLQRIQHRLQGKGGTMVVSYILRERRRGRSGVEGEDRRSSAIPRYIWKFLEDSGVISDLGEKIFFSDTDGALAHLENLLIEESDDEDANDLIHSRSLPVFQGLEVKDIHQVRKMCTRHYFKRGETIFQQGDVGDAIYLITKGRANVYIYLKASGGKKRVQALLGGAVFGEMAVLDSKPRAAEIVAAENSICYRLGVEEFETLKVTAPGLALKLFNNLCIIFSERMRSANSIITELEK